MTYQPTTYAVRTDAVDLPHAVVTTGAYPNGSLAVILVDAESGESETVSTNLAAHQLIAPFGCFYVKDDAEHTDLPDALVAAGLAEKVHTVTYGPPRTPAALMRLAETAV